MSLVGQEPVLYACSVGGNIAYGIEDITQASIEHTARLANAHTFISSMTKGYETATGEKGYSFAMYSYSYCFHDHKNEMKVMTTLMVILTMTLKSFTNYSYDLN